LGDMEVQSRLRDRTLLGYRDEGAKASQIHAWIYTL
jgi:hypothetical protein